MSAGTELRDQGVANALAADTAPQRGAAPYIREAIAALAGMDAGFTAEDVRDLLSDNETVLRVLRDRPNALSATILGAARSGLIECVGYTLARRPARRASVLRIWKGATA